MTASITAEPVLSESSVGSSKRFEGFAANIENEVDDEVEDVLADAEPSFDPEVELVLERARGYLGTTEALQAIRTLYYEGSIRNHKGQLQANLIIYLKKPFFQRIEIIKDDYTDIEASNGYVGWKQRDHVEKPADYRPGAWLITMPPKVLRKMRITAWENLNFFENIEAIDGRVSSKGLTPFEGRPADLLLFEHDTGDVYNRYFDPTTGQLLATESSPGNIVKELGEQAVQNIRFPKQLHYYQNAQLNIIVTFDRIEINRSFADNFFEHPMFHVR